MELNKCSQTFGENVRAKSKVAWRPYSHINMPRPYVLPLVFHLFLLSFLPSILSNDMTCFDLYYYNEHQSLFSSWSFDFVDESSLCHFRSFSSTFCLHGSQFCRRHCRPLVTTFPQLLASRFVSSFEEHCPEFSESKLEDARRYLRRRRCCLVVDR